MSFCCFNPQLSRSAKSKMGSDLTTLVPSIHQELDELPSCWLELFYIYDFTKGGKGMKMGGQREGEGIFPKENVWTEKQLDNH